MSFKNVIKTYCVTHPYSVYVFLLFITKLNFALCGSIIIERDIISNSHSNSSFSLHHIFKRSSGSYCSNSSDCSSELPGGLCIQNLCVCPQGYLPLKKGNIGCYQVGKHLGNHCNSTSQCGNELRCKNHVCLCPEDFQLFQTQGTNICLLWHKPTRHVDRCRLNDDCTRAVDLNSVCKKRWCQCNNGYQLFETMLFGRKHKCFKTHRLQCTATSHCSKLIETPDQHCVCLYGYCHCISALNFTSFDIPAWAERPNWYHRWKKDLILATRLVFITVILFFVPCFIYVTLGMRERSRALFSQLMQPSRSPVIHYSSQRRASHLRNLQAYRGLPGINGRNIGDTHNVEISLQPNGVNSRLVDPRSRLNSHPRSCPSHHHRHDINMKEEDPPPSYDEIMHKEEPPPPYRAL